MGKLVVIVGGQYGSEAKGAVAAHLARTSNKALMAVRVAGPNAGHTVYDDQGVEIKLRQVPVAAVVRPDAQIRIAAGSEVDIGVLYDELNLLHDLGHSLGIGPQGSRLGIDEQATRLFPRHIQAEQEQAIQMRLGSTAKGIGAARAERIWRKASIWGDHRGFMSRTNVADDIRLHLAQGGEVHIEGTQGYGLGLHAGEYPFCTSSDCRAIDFLAMAGISPWDPAVSEFEVWVTLRTYPIRVAGNSGKLAGEHTWNDMQQITGMGDALQPERTTVTNKVRRVGEFDLELARRAIQQNGHFPTVRVALMFADYWGPAWRCIEQYGDLDPEQMARIQKLERDLRAPIELLGTSPQTIIDRRTGQPGNGQMSFKGGGY